jgi:hypothetical protein
MWRFSLVQLHLATDNSDYIILNTIFGFPHGN